jgi:hypothetical protein
LQVPWVFLESTVQTFHECLQGCPTELVFNLDEVGISDRADRKMRKGLAPATIPGQRIRHGISWKMKHISVIACPSAAGELLIA